MTKRAEIVTAIGDALAQISTANGYNNDFDKATYWQDTDSEYQKNHLDFRDTTEDYKKNNQLYNTELRLEIVAVVLGQGTETAQERGTLALEDLIRAVRCLSLPNGAKVNLRRSHKFVETKGKTACQVELEVAVYYKF